MKTRLINLMIVAALLCLALPGCIRPSSGTPVVNTLVPTLPESTLPKNTLPQPTNTFTPVPTLAEPTITSTPEPTAIQHVTQPGNPVYVDLQKIIDCTMYKSYGPGHPPVGLIKSCDNWVAGNIERPLTADLNTYLPYLDIQETQFGSRGDWIYARIRPYDVVPQVGDGDLFYALELDLNFDGVNDVFISVQDLPLSNVVWTVAGARAWKSVNGVATLSKLLYWMEIFHLPGGHGPIKEILT